MTDESSMISIPATRAVVGWTTEDALARVEAHWGASVDQAGEDWGDYHGGLKLWDGSGVPEREYVELALRASASVREVEVAAFTIRRSRVSVDEWLVFLRESGREDKRPTWLRSRSGSMAVLGVSHEDASAFAAWAGLSLPTEDEWLIAAGAGQVTPWDDPATLAALEARRRRGVDAHEAGSASRWGVLDLVGTDWEWCSTELGPLPGGDAVAHEAFYPGATRLWRVLRGGWSPEQQWSVHARLGAPPHARRMPTLAPSIRGGAGHGFRLVHRGAGEPRSPRAPELAPAASAVAAPRAGPAAPLRQAPVGLERARLDDADLSGADFEGSTFASASLNRANLRGARLAGATLRFCKLHDADLRGADLRGATLDYCELDRAKLEGACFDGAVLETVVLDHVEARGASFEGATLRAQAIFGADLREVSFRGARFDRLSIHGGDATGACFDELEGEPQFSSVGGDPVARSRSAHPRRYVVVAIDTFASRGAHPEEAELELGAFDTRAAALGDGRARAAIPQLYADPALTDLVEVRDTSTGAVLFRAARPAG